jgi:hypothetical protein
MNHELAYGAYQISKNEDREKAVQYGLNAGEANTFVQRAFGGNIATTVYEADRQFGRLSSVKSHGPSHSRRPRRQWANAVTGKNTRRTASAARIMIGASCFWPC